MSETQDIPAAQPIANITGYHAHIYYDIVASRDRAGLVRQRIAERFPVQVGNWHDELVGPHLRPMYQVAFGVEQFATLVPWLMLNRQGLTVLVHPNTDNPQDDHLVNPLWLGEVLPVDAKWLPTTRHGEPETVTPNTRPHLSP